VVSHEITSGVFLKGDFFVLILQQEYFIMKAIKQEFEAMTKTVEKVMRDAMELSTPLRAFVAERLIESLDNEETPELSAKWKTEIRQRCKEIESGTAKMYSAETVFKRAYASLP
jgi:putative addiction module component (TIGR02574 family)